jgi:Eco57I restriction-modification methylase
MTYFKKIEALTKLKIKPNSDINNITTLIKMNMKSLSNKCELMKYITENLRPKKQDVKKYGAVYTPPLLIEEVLSKLPMEVWRNKDLKWLGPGCGIGNFEVCIYYRLMDGLKDDITCEDERKKHILENMLHVVELDPKSAHIYKQIFEGSKYKLNVFEGSFMDFNSGHYDVIVGNPPYQEIGTQGKPKHGKVNLYTKFVLKALEIIKPNGYICFITPTSWLSPSSLILDKLTALNILHLNVNECEKHFAGVGSKFCYYVIENSPSTHSSEVVVKYKDKVYASVLDLKSNHLPNFLTKHVLSIQHKVFKNTSSPFIRKDALFKKCNINESYSDEFRYPIVVKHNKDVWSSVPHKHQTDKKVLLFRSGYLKPTYDNGVKGFGENIMFHVVETEEEGRKIVDLYSSPLYKFLLDINKFSGYNNGVILNLMFIDVSLLPNDFTEKHLVNHFAFSLDEVAFLKAIGVLDV